jgi:hypothetical protein
MIFRHARNRRVRDCCPINSTSKQKMIEPVNPAMPVEPIVPLTEVSWRVFRADTMMRAIQSRFRAAESLANDGYVHFGIHTRAWLTKVEAGAKQSALIQDHTIASHQPRLADEVVRM